MQIKCHAFNHFKSFSLEGNFHRDGSPIAEVMNASPVTAGVNVTLRLTYHLETYLIVIISLSKVRMDFSHLPRYFPKTLIPAHQIPSMMVSMLVGIYFYLTFTQCSSVLFSQGKQIFKQQHKSSFISSAYRRACKTFETLGENPGHFLLQLKGCGCWILVYKYIIQFLCFSVYLKSATGWVFCLSTALRLLWKVILNLTASRIIHLDTVWDIFILRISLFVKLCIGIYVSQGCDLCF